MANVVQLQFADRRRTDVAHAARASAEIIIFPGVRISRGTPVLAGKVSKPGAKSKRPARRGKAKRPSAARAD